MQNLELLTLEMIMTKLEKRILSEQIRSESDIRYQLRSAWERTKGTDASGRAYLQLYYNLHRVTSFALWPKTSRITMA